LLKTGLLRQHFSQNFICGLGDSPLRSNLKSRFRQTTIADPMKNGDPYFDMFADRIAVINTPVV